MPQVPLPPPRKMKKLALQIMRRCGVFSATRALSAKMGRILTYHDFCAAEGCDPEAAVTATAARKHLEHLRRHFRVVTLRQMAEQLASARGLESKLVAVTIDDGRRNFYDHFFPLLQKFEIPATLFVVSSFSSGADWIWTDKVQWLSRQSALSTELAPANLARCFRMLNQKRPEERNHWISATAARVGLTIPQHPPAPYEPCSWSQLREMSASGLVEIGAHTVTHPILSSITDEESWREINDSRRQIEQALGQTVACFCFPNGKFEDYRPSQVQQVRDAGYVCSVTTQFGFVDQRADPYQLPRVGAGLSDTMNFYKRIDGLMHYRNRLAGR